MTSLRSRTARNKAKAQVRRFNKNKAKGKVSKKVSNKTYTVRLQKRREAQQRYRDKIKRNTSQYEKIKEQDRLRKKLSVEGGEIKRRKDLNERELRAVRSSKRKYMKEYRARKAQKTEGKHKTFLLLLILS